MRYEIAGVFVIGDETRIDELLTAAGLASWYLPLAKFVGEGGRL